MQAGLRELAVQVSRIAEDAGKHALKDQLMPKDLVTLNTVQRDYSRGLKVGRPSVAVHLQSSHLHRSVQRPLGRIAPTNGRPVTGTGAWAVSMA